MSLRPLTVERLFDLAGAPRAVAWLLSPDASCTTGAVLRVSGGR